MYSARDLCTDAERERMANELGRVYVDDGYCGGVVVTTHPTRLHDEFVRTNRENYGNQLLWSHDLRDGWTLTVMRLAGDREIPDDIPIRWPALRDALRYPLLRRTKASH